MTKEELDSLMLKAKKLFKKEELLFGKNGAFRMVP